MPKKRQPYTVGFFGTFALVITVVIYLFSTTYNPEEVNAFFTMFLILLTGIVLSKIMVGWNFTGFNFRNLFLDIISTVIAFVSIYFVNKFVPIEMGISPIGQMAFAMLAGVAEEWMFRLWLCAWISDITHPIIGIPVSAGVWAWFHLARASAFGLGPVNWGYITLVFCAGIPLGFITLWFRSADGPTFGHMAINALANS